MPFQVPVGPFQVPVRHFQGSVGIHTKAWDGSVSLAPFHFQAKVTFVCERNVCFGFKQVSSPSLLPRAQLHLFDTISEYTNSSKNALMKIICRRSYLKGLI